MAFSLPSSSSSSSSPSPPRWSHDVFLSFRGIDTRNTFTAHLYHALCQRGIKTYKDDKDLERGETISPTLLKAIEESMTSIIVLSQNYASSTWCLEELTKILECKKTKQQIVLPVFYHIHPSEVRNLRGSFGEALAKHQERFKEDPKVQRWKEALQEVAGLAGEHLEDGNEYEFMQKIIQWVDSTIAKSKCQLDIAEYPIGLKSRLKDLNTNLGIGRNDITLMTGIYGTGGIGKTTTAKAIFNSIGHQFEARCFLANVRENSSREDGLVKLQEKLLCELLGNSKSFTIGSVGGTNVIKNRLHSKRVLLILDDVNELRQLKELAGNKNWFGRGSRIVITTRDQRLLAYHQVDSTYEVQGLDDNQAIQLFSWHAFERDNPVESYVELTKAIIVYAKGLPLALIVLGSYLRDRSIQEWKSALEKYERSPHKDIYEILKISYDGLDNNEKDIFLDIACFFKGNSVEYVMKILDSCGFSSTIGIARLKEKCLINIQYHQWVEMHDLLQEMGKEIVRQESPKEAGKRRRLFFHEDVRHVLEENTGTDKIEGILLDFPEGHDHMICLHPEAFMNMKNLRFFRSNLNVQFSAGPNDLSNQLRVLNWPEYPSSILPSNFDGRNLVEFQMSFSLVKELGGLKCKNLRCMNLSGCKSLTKIPDLSSCPNLKTLNLSYCENLVEVHDSVKLRMPNSLITFKNLTYMNLSGCKSLTKIPDLSSCPNLEWLNLSNCENLVEVHDSVELRMPNSLITFKNLTVMDLSGCKSLTKIPDLSSCPNLQRLDLSYCENLVEVHDFVELRMPNSLITFKNLTVMNFSRCKFLPKILDLSSCPNLKMLNLSYCENLVEVHDSVKLRMPNSLITFKNLTVMDLSGCKSLTKIPDLSSCPNLQRLDLRYCENLVEVHDFVELRMPNSLITFKNLTVMNFSRCKFLPKILDLSSCPNLKMLNLSYCENLVEVHDSVKLRMPNSLITFKNLTVMDLSGCKSLTKIPDLSSCPNLQRLDLSYCENLVEVHDFVELRMPNSLITFKNLTVMNFSRCKFLPKVLDLSSCPNLKMLNLSYCENLVEVHDYVKLRMPNSLITFKNLIYMNLRGCKSLTKILALSSCPNLEWLNLSNCANLVEVHDSVELRMPNSLITFKNLIYMNLSGCKSLTKILALSSCPNLGKLDLSHCTSLESFALLSEILIKNNGTSVCNYLSIYLYGCHKLLANMKPIPSWEEEQNWAEPLKRERDIGIIFPGKRIPNWFSYRNEAHDSTLFEIDIKPPHHCYGILLYVVSGVRVGIIDPITDDAIISVVIHDGSDEKKLPTQVMTVSWMDSDHVWMYRKCYRPDKQTVSRVTFKCKSKLVVFRRIGIHFLRLGSKFHYYSSDEEIDSSLDLMDEKRHSSILELDNDDENPKEDLELENDDENLKEIFGKRRRHDEYDCNLELNLYPQQKRQHSSTMGIRITELENDDEYPKEYMDLELKLGL